MIYTEPNSFLPRCVPREVELVPSAIHLVQSRKFSFRDAPRAKPKILLPRCASCGVGKAKLTKGFNTLAVTNYILLNSFIINKRRTNTSNPYTGYIFVETRWCRVVVLESNRCSNVESLRSCRIVTFLRNIGFLPHFG